MVEQRGSAERILNSDDIEQVLVRSFERMDLDGKRVLVIIPDGTRTAPIPLLFRLLDRSIGKRVAQLDYLIALGTHPPMSEEAIDHLVGVSAAERAQHYPKTQIFNHHWSDAQTLKVIGVITPREASAITEGILAEEVPVALNRMIFEYDQLMICGPVFPHEVAGFSGGAKYLFPGIAGADIINFSHWLGARVTSMKTIGMKDTLTRRVIHRAAAFVSQPLLCIALVMGGENVHGIFVGDYVEAFEAAADLSARLNIVLKPHAFQRVLSLPSTQYDDLWTAAKAMYKTEPIVADGGEVIIYAPNVTEVSYTHGKLIDQIGYHVRDYFLKQWSRFENVPGGILAHSTHVKGTGTYDVEKDIEQARITVTLATGIPEERCQRINLGYADYHAIDPHAWENREDEGLLLVPHAGEVLYRLAVQ